MINTHNGQKYRDSNQDDKFKTVPLKESWTDLMLLSSNIVGLTGSELMQLNQRYHLFSSMNSSILYLKISHPHYPQCSLVSDSLVGRLSVFR